MGRRHILERWPACHLYHGHRSQAPWQPRLTRLPHHYHLYLQKRVSTMQEISNYLNTFNQKDLKITGVHYFSALNEISNQLLRIELKTPATLLLKFPK